MRIAIDARFYGTENGGLGRYTVNLVQELSQSDHKNTYVLLLSEKYYKTLRVSKNFEKVLIRSRHYSLKEQIEVIRSLNKINPDLTHFLHFNVPLFFNKKYVVTIHDLLMHRGIGKEATTLPFWKYLIKRMGYRLVFDHAVKSARHIIVPSQFVKKEVENTYHTLGDNISVVHEGVSFVKFLKKSKPHTDNYFLYVGNAYPHKNISTLLRALSLVNTNALQKIKLVLVTPRDVFTKRLTGLMETMNLSHLVDIKNNINDEELQVLYRHAIAFVYPSFSEGFGLPGLESMYSNTRLISSDIPVFHELYQNHAEYFNPTSAEDLSLSMLKVLNEKLQARRKEIQSAYNFVKKYSWKNMARDTLAIYETT